MTSLKMKCLMAFAFLVFTQMSHAFTIKMSGDGGALGEKAESADCQADNGAEAFTTNAGLTVYTDEQFYSGGRALKMTVREGSTGFGTFGGSIEFNNCQHVGGHVLREGDEVWIRTRIYFPGNFEFNSGRNKFFRLRAYNQSSGQEKSEGYNDLYIDSHTEVSGFKPFWYIFEGQQSWYAAGSLDDFFEPGEWKTVEFYLKLDDEPVSKGGEAIIRIWIDGKLIGEAKDRRTLNTSDSYIKYFSYFTYYGNDRAPQTQSVYVDDFFLTTDTPDSMDGFGNRYIGLGEPRTFSSPSPPSDLKVD